MRIEMQRGVKKFQQVITCRAVASAKAGRSNNGGKMTTEEVAKKVVELVRKQAWYEALDTLYDNDIVSVEATAPDTRGKEAVRGKIDWWVNAMQVHTFKASEPFVAHDRFVLQYDADVTEKESKKKKKNV